VNATAARPAQRYRCRCEHVFQALGQGRGRRFYELGDLGWTLPVVERICRSRQQRLPTTPGLLSPEARP
jgi:hypothetical protein